MADTFQLPESVTGARERASQLSGVAGEYKAGEISVIDALRAKVTEAYSANQDIIQNLEKAIGEYLPSPQVGREKYQNIFNPFQRESLVSKYTASKAIPMLTGSALLGQRLGRIEDLVGAGTRAFGAESTRAQNQATLAQNQYTNLLAEYTATAPTIKEVEAGGRKYLVTYDRNGNVVNQVDMGAAPASGGSGTNITIQGMNVPGLNQGGQGGVSLTDPNTGQVWQYDSVNDPEYIYDYSRWYSQSQQTPTPQASPSSKLKGTDIYSQPYG